MASQTAALSEETKAMRSIDVALQQAGNLKGRARERVLRYAAEESAARLQPAGLTPGTAEHVLALADQVRDGALG